MFYLTIEQILDIHHQIIAQTGGGLGITNPGLTANDFWGSRNATLPEKAAALGFFLIKNHLFLDGNKRTGHAAM
ncbi:type II toxin-antitoxin system death-on-curing family toxin [Planktothricoides sp. SR001]|uniref:type II toxin-antitoxin system death-on-curing family toxin n=1 Tax=Planktothricoides sp. SR001 TaxID=1705388 RepID=UPI000A3DF2CB|nr:Fic family protein [Planktothricoides sp. SR001]